MKIITKETDYAIRVLLCMARNAQRQSVATLAEELEMPRPFLRKTLQTLNKKGVLKSHKGTGGGFALNIDLKQYSIYDLMGALQGPFQLNEHLMHGKICPHVDHCKLKKKLKILEKKIITELQSVKLSTLC